MNQKKKTPPKEKFTSIEALAVRLSEQKSNTNIEIEFTNLEVNLKYSEIPLHLIYDKCIHLDLNLKGFASNQDDFDTFCSQISTFKQLDTFSIRFYNKQVGFLDSLFNNIVNIRKVSLNLKCFKKIRLRSEFSYPMKVIQDLSINLKNTTFKDKQSRVILENFISRQQTLNTFRISLKKLDHLKFLLAAPKKTSLYLNLRNPSIDLDFCDELIQFKQKYGLKQLYIEQSKIMIGVYLQSQGINLVNYYLKSPVQTYYFQEFTAQDMQLLDKVPYLLEHMVKSKENILLLKGKQNQAELVFKLILPREYLFKNISFNFESISYAKKDNIWIVEYYRIWSTNSFCQFFFQNLINIRIEFDSLYFQGLNHTIIVLKVIQDAQYLILYQIQKNYQYNLLQNNNKIQFQLELLTQQENIIQQKTTDKLRYYAFLKYFYELIPLPQQVFYDLIQI